MCQCAQDSKEPTLFGLMQIKQPCTHFLRGLFHQIRVSPMIKGEKCGNATAEEGSQEGKSTVLTVPACTALIQSTVLSCRVLIQSRGDQIMSAVKISRNQLISEPTVSIANRCAGRFVTFQWLETCLFNLQCFHQTVCGVGSINH